MGDGHSLDASDGNPVNQVFVDAAGEVGIGTTTPNEDLHLHDSTGLVYQRFTNTTTGSTPNDGFKIGINGAGNAYIHQQEAADINFSTSGVFAGKFDDDGTFELGNNLVSGAFELYLNGSTYPTVTIGNDGNLGGALNLWDYTGSEHSVIEPDVDGGGAGFLMTMDGFGSVAFYVDGNAGDNNCEVVIVGSGSGTTFDTSESGDGSVVLPTSAVNATEMIDEPGVASATGTSSFGLTGGTDVLLSRTISSPGPGYVLAIATAEAYCPGGSPSDGANFGVSPASGSYPTGGKVYVRVPDGSGTGNWYQSVTVHGLFEVTGGDDTFYFLATGVIGSWTVTDRKLTLLYVPTSYGTVSRTELAEADNPETDVPPAGRPLTESDLAFERSGSIAANQARIDAELAAVKAEMAELRARLEEQNGRNN